MMQIRGFGWVVSHTYLKAKGNHTTYSIETWDAVTVMKWLTALFTGDLNHFIVASSAGKIRHIQSVNYGTLAVVMRHHAINVVYCTKYTYKEIILFKL